VLLKKGALVSEQGFKAVKVVRTGVSKRGIGQLLKMLSGLNFWGIGRLKKRCKVVWDS
jgi:hypothetical protein